VAGLVSNQGNPAAQAGDQSTPRGFARRAWNAGGPDNPLGARALYLWQGKKDTLYRIHGTNEPETIGQSVSSGCIRMVNEEVVDLYAATSVGTKVVVLPTRLG
jgi:lipoprotein-anchoring transpeptidase ErfK/SrfK